MSVCTVGSAQCSVYDSSAMASILFLSQAFDTDDNDTFSTVYYEIIAVDPPYLVNRDTGEVTTADTFTGRSGEIDRFTVVAYDNEGNEPSYTSTAILTVSEENWKVCGIYIFVVFADPSFQGVRADSGSG